MTSQRGGGAEATCYLVAVQRDISADRFHGYPDHYFSIESRAPSIRIEDRSKRRPVNTEARDRAAFAFLN
jgi:hypothetical protein